MDTNRDGATARAWADRACADLGQLAGVPMEAVSARVQQLGIGTLATVMVRSTSEGAGVRPGTAVGPDGESAVRSAVERAAGGDPAWVAATLTGLQERGQVRGWCVEPGPRESPSGQGGLERLLEVMPTDTRFAVTTTGGHYRGVRGDEVAVVMATSVETAAEVDRLLDVVGLSAGEVVPGRGAPGRAPRAIDIKAERE